MTFVDIAPWVTSFAALAQVAIVRTRPVLGFGIGLAVQPVWVVLCLMTKQWGFLAATAGFIGINAWNLRAAFRTKQQTPRLTHIPIAELDDELVYRCSRTKPHDGPCNGWQTEECNTTVAGEGG